MGRIHGENEDVFTSFRQLERQVMLNSGLAKRCSALASELTVLTGISEAVLKQRDIDVAPAGAKTALAKRREELHRAYDQAMDRALELDRLPAE